MVYRIFLRKNRGVIHEIWINKENAMDRFDKLSSRYPEVTLSKERYSKKWDNMIEVMD